jgi:hypothetical protein
MKLTKAQAKKYSLIKWNHARRTGCTYVQLEKWLRKNHSVIFEFQDECGYCEYYKNRGGSRKKYAEQIYQDIKRS